MLLYQRYLFYSNERRAKKISTKKAKVKAQNIHVYAGQGAPKVLNKGYSEAGASHIKKALKGMIPNSGAPWEDIDLNNYTLRQRSRMLIMGAPLAKSAIATNRTNVVGNGLRLKSTINRHALGMSQQQAEEWQRHTEAEFELWASRKNACDATGMNDFYGIQQLALVSWLASGDVFGLIKRYDTTPLQPYSLRLHLIEADRVRTPTDSTNFTYPSYTIGKTEDGNTIFDGVEIDSNGMVVAYHIANSYPYEFTAEQTEWARVEAYGAKSGLPNILHIMESERPDQYRGVPYLAQVIEPLLQTRRYTEAEIMSAVIQSFYTAFIITNEDANEMPMNEALGEDAGEISHDENEYELGSGTINVLEPGEDVKFAAPTHPNSGFDVFMRAMAEQMGAALEIPADLLLKSFNSSYSASRAALLEAWKAFKMRRVWLTNDLCKPVYEIWLTEAVARGRIIAPGFLTDPIIRQAYLQSEWIGPSQGQLDPTKEISAAVMAIENGLSTREQETIKLNGGQFTANVDKLAIENEKLKAANGTSEPDLGQQFANFIQKTVEKAVEKEVKNQNEQQ